jgi:uncharacterized alpha-E superfamily protein
MLTLSRVADTLYWIARCLERAEHSARLLDLHLHLLLDQTPVSAELRWERLLLSLHIPVPPSGKMEAYSITNLITFDTANNNSIASCVAAARENARNVREQISSEMWEQVNRLYFQVRQTHIDNLWNDQPHEFLRTVKEGVHLFQGITDSTMNNGEGWQFIQLGRFIERAETIAKLLDTHYSSYPDIPLHNTIIQDFLEWVGLLKSCTAYEAYCKVYMADLRPDCIAEFLLLNAEFPHSVRFSVDGIYSALHAIAQSTESKRSKHVNRLAGRLRAALDYGAVDEILANGLNGYLEDIQQQCGKIHNAIYSAYLTYPADEFVS